MSCFVNIYSFTIERGLILCPPVAAWTAKQDVDPHDRKQEVKENTCFDFAYF